MRLGTAISIAAALALAAAPLAAELYPASPLPSVDDVYPRPPSWRGVRVLHIGDSNVALGLVAGLRKRLHGAGAIYEPHGWSGSRSKSWVVSGKLTQLLDELLPQVVIVTLETNTLGSPKTHVHAAWVKRLVERIGRRDCYWLGPPPLLDDPYGYTEILPRACAPCRYFDTARLPYPKRPGGHFHLTREEGLDWAERVWSWMNSGGGSDAL